MTPKSNSTPQPAPEGPRKAANQVPAYHKLMDLLARRDHSERELRQKLARRYEKDEIDQALELAKQQKWLKPPQELSADVAHSLHRRQKSHRYINRYLSGKGLPAVAADRKLELRKAFAIIRRRWTPDKTPSFLERQKMARLLAGRGFDEQTIRTAVFSDAIDDE